MLNNIFQIELKENYFISRFKLFSKNRLSSKGILYTFYSDQLNLIEIGFAKNNKILKEKMRRKEFILLDKKDGNPLDLFLIIKTLKMLDIKLFHRNYFIYSNKTLRHLKTLGWPIGNSLYKKRIIRKRISYALT